MVISPLVLLALLLSIVVFGHFEKGFSQEDSAAFHHAGTSGLNDPTASRCQTQAGNWAACLVHGCSGRVKIIASSKEATRGVNRAPAAIF
jgi:hypothetical protein